MNAVDMPPPFCLVPRVVQQIGAFNPWRLSFIVPPIFRRDSTSNAPDRPIDAARSIGSPWRVHTSSNAIDRVLDISSAPLQGALDVPGQISEVKRLTGFGWEKIAELLRCSRQAVHRWILGDPISHVNRDRLARLHATIRFIDRGSAEANRELLNTAFDGHALVELLERGSFEDVRTLAGRGGGRADAKWGKIDRKEIPSEDHWFSRLAEGEDARDSLIVRAKPQAIKRLKLRKG